jgi:uncharacterized protein YciI
MAHFAVTMVNGPGWDPTRDIREQDAWDAHAAFMDGLVADGFVIIGGPVGDRQRKLLAIEAAGEPAIRARLAADPWVAMGLLQIGSVEPWALWLDGRPVSAAR